jgi:hypothetical protein
LCPKSEFASKVKPSPKRFQEPVEGRDTMPALLLAWQFLIIQGFCWKTLSGRDIIQAFS